MSSTLKLDQPKSTKDGRAFVPQEPEVALQQVLRIRDDPVPPKPKQQAAPKPTDRISFFNGLRGFSAMCVVYAHYSTLHSYSILERPYKLLGELAVWQFFAMSAFLITKSMYGRFRTTKKTGKSIYPVMLDYAIRRIMRIYPLLTTFLFFLWLFPQYKVSWYAGADGGVVNWNTFLPIRSMTFLWTIPIEVQYYFILPLFPYVAIYWVGFGWILACTVAVIAGIVISIVTPAYPDTENTILNVLPIFLYSTASAILVEKTKEFMQSELYKKWLRKIPSFIQFSAPYAIDGLTFALYGLALWASIPAVSLVFGSEIRMHEELLVYFLGLWVPTSSRTVQGPLLALVLYFISFVPGSISTLFDWGLLQYYGKISYSSFLFHIYPIYFVQTYFDGVGYEMGVLLTFAMVIPMSSLSYFLVEKQSLSITNYLCARVKWSADHYGRANAVKQKSTAVLEDWKARIWKTKGVSKEAMHPIDDEIKIYAVDTIKVGWMFVNSTGGIEILTEANSGCNGYTPTTTADLKSRFSKQFVTVACGRVANMRNIWSDSKRRYAAISAMTKFVNTLEFSGIELDWEEFALWTDQDWSNFQQFVADLGRRLHAHKKLLYIDTPMITSQGDANYYKFQYEAFDTTMSVVDSIVVMAYDYQLGRGVGKPRCPNEWMLKGIAWIKDRVKNLKRITVGIANDCYVGAPGTYSGRFIPQIAMNQTILSAVLSSPRDPSSFEYLYATNGRVYNCIDQKGLQMKRDLILKTGVKQVSLWYIVLNALEIDPNRPWKGAWRWYDETLLDCCSPLETIKSKGITFNEFASLARCNGLTVEAKRNVSLDEFKRDLKAVCSGQGEGGQHQQMVVSFSRKVLHQTGDGHFSPVGCFHEESGMVLVLDVARFKYPSYFVHVDVLHEAMEPVDKVTGKSRGYFLLSKKHKGGGGDRESGVVNIMKRGGNYKSVIEAHLKTGKGSHCVTSGCLHDFTEVALVKITPLSLSKTEGVVLRTKEERI
ncbi:UNVERIFIED_CONTAM: hypothetical protein HDU68_010145 [Siphonaria sp. JEL0065]|nr:hypothetical protein HDU68_010145 [Siphonaria sp. JEL0065]